MLPLHLPVLYPHCLTLHASRKAISGRTSYHQVRLAFHPEIALRLAWCVKQSRVPFHCGSHIAMGASLLPRLRDHFAEFLNQVSLAHLRIFTPPTCVGLRYGYNNISLRGFSWQCSWATFHGSPHGGLGLRTTPLDLPGGA